MGDFHDWSEEDFDWKSLYKAEKLICRVCKLFRLGVHTKEKYGTLRVTSYPFDGSLHSLIYPGYVYSQFPKWLWKLDYFISFKIMNKFPLKYLVAAIQLFQFHVGYRLAYYLAMKKYSHIAEEISTDADYPEFIIDWEKVNKK